MQPREVGDVLSSFGAMGRPVLGLDLDAIASRLNSRPRKILDFQTPYEVYHQLVETCANPASNVALQN